MGLLDCEYVLNNNHTIISTVWSTLLYSILGTVECVHQCFLQLVVTSPFIQLAMYVHKLFVKSIPFKERNKLSWCKDSTISSNVRMYASAERWCHMFSLKNTVQLLSRFSGQWCRLYSSVVCTRINSPLYFWKLTSALPSSPCLLP